MLTTQTDAAGTTKFYYDKLGNITKSIRTIDSVDYTIETAYDALGRTTSVKYPDNETISYTFDTGGNLSQVGSFAMYSNYNALGQPGTVTYGNGVNTINQYLPTNNRLYSITTNSPTAGLINNAYTYDNAGNILSITDIIDGTRSQSFAYDDLNRLTQAQSTSYGTLTYSYSEIGNILSKEGVSYTYNGTGPHAVTTTSDGKTYSYDANGNMTADGQRSISYDYDNMPSSMTVSGSSTSFVYDAEGSRVKKITSSATTLYIGKLYECANGSCSKYIFAGSERIALKNSVATYYYHQDHLGSSNVVTDASGNTIEEIHYLPFGSTVSDTGSVSVNHKFTSQELDSETGLYYYGARYYNPVLGRFISPDSMVPYPSDPQNFNRYSYAGNNPIIYIDPDGHFFLIDDILIGAAVGAIIGGTAAAVTGNDIGQGIVTGAIGGAFLGGAGGIIGGLGITSSIAQAGIYSGAGAGAGATSASIYGGDIGQAALYGGSFGLAMYYAPVPSFQPFGASSFASVPNRLFNAGITGSAFGATFAGVTGEDIGSGAMMGAAGWMIGEGVNISIGHGLGYAMSDSYEFKDGKFYYYSNGQQVFTVGGVIIGDKRELDLGAPVNGVRTNKYTVRDHEIMKHGPQQIMMGPGYLLAHIAAQGLSLMVTGGQSTHQMNPFERGGAYPSY